MIGDPECTFEEVTAAFTMAPSAIPVGIRCRRSGRLHLPARLWPLAIDSRPGGGAAVELRRIRCNAAGSLLLEQQDPAHSALLVTWCDHADGTAAGHDIKASA